MKITATIETSDHGLLVNVYRDRELQYGVPARTARKIADDAERLEAICAVDTFRSVVGVAAFRALCEAS